MVNYTKKNSQMGVFLYLYIYKIINLLEYQNLLEILGL